MSVLLMMMVISTQSAIDWSYDSHKASGKFCPERDSCSLDRGRSSRGSLDLDWNSRNCFCDDDCSIYADCCIDAPAFDPVIQRENFKKFSCKSLRQYGSIYMRSECPSDWSLEKISGACSSASSTSDPFGSMPVTHMKTGITYANYYCAVCNSVGGEKNKLKFWQPRLECPTLMGYQSRFKNLTKQYLTDRLTYNEEKRQWGVEIENEVQIPVFHVCYFDPFLPLGLEEKVRSCSDEDEMVSDCPDEVKDSDESELCSSYTSLVYGDNVAYRNPHCAICNNVTSNNMICLKLEGRRMGFRSHFQPNSFAVLFDINSGDGDHVGLVDCSNGELWDPFYHTCRNVVCGEEGQVFIDGVCYDEGEVPETTTSTTTTKTTTTVTTTTVTTTAVTTTTVTTPTTSTSTTSTTTTTTTSTTTTTEPSTTKSTVTTTAKTASVTTKTTVNSMIVFPTETISVNLPKIDNTSTPNTILSTITSTKTPPVDSTTTSTTITTTTTKQPITTTTPRSTTTIPHSTTTTPPSTTTSNSVDPPSLQTCPKFLLSPKDFFLLPNDSVQVPGYHLTLSPTDYHLSNTGLYICKPELITSPAQAKFSPVMGYVTLTCLGISLLCLILHLIVTAIAPELQNLSGKNLASLSLSLVGSYSSFLAQMVAPTTFPLPCLILATIMYYFYLSAFFWMLNIAFDVARTLKLATTELRLSSGSQWCKFLVYSLTGWLLPGVMVAVVVLLDQLDLPQIPDSFKPGLGSSPNIGLCWFSRRFSLLIYFVVPFSVIMTLNILFFIWSACMVWDSSRVSAKITTAAPKTNFHLYLRLALLMGLTWVAGLVAGGLDYEPVWYVFLVLNSLQGLFILVFFTCSKKVITSVRERICGARSDDELNSAWRWSGKLGGGPLDSRESQESAVSSGSSNTMLVGRSGGPFRYSSYDQYHQYDQRFYS